ncbi:universal stress protein [Salinadaptatus halalkaliphilus]|uniref:Universal stress protein n=1 Tax=Salinadaptatus halalkaliphilus TaxID=2419781 RepID=A0A4S3TKQ6_9EURY|nr:universal stress protein [Salinadaptatus halalkaliphilus]THE64724.1 universal stress protein [Salinadaptatus halalkaliphilus]
MTVDTLLIPTDGSDPAEAAAARGFDLAAQLQASVHVLSVADSSVATGAGYAGDSASIRSRLRERASARATALQADAEERGLDATAAVREGIPANEIVGYADEHGIDGIVIGTAGRSGITRALVGSVADKVVRTATVPVVTITPEAATETTSTIESILCPTDGSESATTATHHSLSVADQLEAAVHFLSVIDSDLGDRVVALTNDDGDPLSGLHERAETHLETLASHGQERNFEVETATRNGEPAEEIVAYADTDGIDLIAMGTAGRGGFERALVGSVTDTVIRTASVPVLTVRPDEPHDDS